MDLFIPGTKNTPNIIFNSVNNEWEISGRSYPNEALDFYAPLMKRFADYENADVKPCTINFRLEFFNTNSSGILLDILLRLRKKRETKGFAVTVKWFYEEDDVDMKETGESLMEISGLEFELIPY